MKFRTGNRSSKTAKGGRAASKACDQDEWWIVKDQRQSQNPGATQLLDRCIRHYQWDDRYARRVLLGYRQFLELKASMEDWTGDVLHPSAPIDQMWQQHVLDIGNYIRDCKLLFRKLVQYTPEAEDLTERERTHRIKTTQLALKARFGRQVDVEIWDFNAVQPIHIEKQSSSSEAASIIPEVNSMLDFASGDTDDNQSALTLSTNNSSVKAATTTRQQRLATKKLEAPKQRKFLPKNISKSFSFSARKHKEKQPQPTVQRRQDSQDSGDRSQESEEQYRQETASVIDEVMSSPIIVQAMEATPVRMPSPNKSASPIKMRSPMKIASPMPSLPDDESNSIVSSEQYSQQKEASPQSKASYRPSDLPKFNVGAFPIKIKFTGGDTRVVRLDSANCRVLDLKYVIEQEIGVNVIDQRLIYAGRQLDDRLPLSRYGVKPQSTISLIKSLFRP